MTNQKIPTSLISQASANSAILQMNRKNLEQQNLKSEEESMLISKLRSTSASVEAFLQKIKDNSFVWYEDEIHISVKGKVIPFGKRSPIEYKFSKEFGWRG